MEFLVILENKMELFKKRIKSCLGKIPPAEVGTIFGHFRVFLFFIFTLLLVVCSSPSKYVAADDLSPEESYVSSDTEDDTEESFAGNLAKLQFPDEFKLEEVVLGQDNAPVTLVMYTSFSCPHCRKFHLEEFPKFKKRYVDTGKVKVYLRSYLDDLGALESATLVRCLCGQSINEITKIYHYIFSQQPKWLKSEDPREFLKKIFRTQKYAPEDIDKCIENQRVLAGLMKEQQRAMHEFKLISMPAFIVNGKIHQGMITCQKLADMCGVN
ncbi:MAG: thioredoxin domain-containing protein [Holosporaceae bacterium]|jgi:protein-disulfide isomerase|nr:thioredoxin domain-containing protein [Holosporaceae bacterium]